MSRSGRRALFTGDAVHVTVQFSDQDRRRFLADTRLAIAQIDDSGDATPFPAAARNA